MEITSAEPQPNVSAFYSKPSQLFFPSPVSEKLQLLNSGFYVRVKSPNECLRSGFIDMRSYKPVSWNQL